MVYFYWFTKKEKEEKKEERKERKKVTKKESKERRKKSRKRKKFTRKREYERKTIRFYSLLFQHDIFTNFTVMIVKVLVFTVLFVFGLGAAISWILFEISKAAERDDKTSVEHKNF